MTQPVIREATPDDLARFYGEMPRRSTRAFVAMLDDEPIAVAGLAYQRRGEAPYFYSEMKPAMRSRKKAIVKLAHVLLGTLGDRVAYASADPMTTAPRFLSGLGFECVGSKDGRIIFRWVPR